MNAGEEFDLSDDVGILAIKSPHDFVKGPPLVRQQFLI
jgi:hypothetical protein